MKPNKIIVKFEDVAEQVNGPVKRLVGFVLAKNMLDHHQCSISNGRNGWMASW